jgi:hypothetical protein
VGLVVVVAPITQALQVRRLAKEIPVVQDSIAVPLGTVVVAVVVQELLEEIPQTQLQLLQVLADQVLQFLGFQQPHEMKSVPE